MKPATSRERVSHYTILNKLGAGGMGDVYLAEDTLLHRRVAIKFLPYDSLANQKAICRLIQEAQAAAKLDHPNICTVHEVAEDAGRSFIVMEYVEGETLASRIRNKPLTLSECLEIAVQVADALVAAHSQGVTHRDITPQNIMLTAHHQAKVIDFGLAKIIRDRSAVDSEAVTETLLTDTGVIVGTVAYMSPEQVRGRPLDARSDIFSFGAVLYEMVTGHPAFAAESTAMTISATKNREPAPLARYSRGVPAELERIVSKALRKARRERYQTAKDLLTDLKDLRHRVELQGELERSGPPAGKGTLTSRPAPAKTSPFASSAEYVINQVKLHKLATVVSLIVLTLALTATLSWYFKPSRARPILTDKDTILIADFENKTGDEVFDGTLKQGLAVQLGQSPFLSIFPESGARQTLKLMNRSPDERVTALIAREICERQGLKAYIAGSIAPLGSHYVLTLEAINGQSGAVLAREQMETQGKEQLLSTLSQAVTKLRERLGESLSSIEKFGKPLQEVTTSSLEALKAYSLGKEQENKGANLESIPFYKRAIELDPNFASAYVALARQYHNTGQLSLKAEYAAKAYALQEKVSERERLMITNFYYAYLTHEWDKHVEILEVLKHTYPRDAYGPFGLSDVYFNIGQFEKAVGEAEEAIRRNPNIAGPHINLAQALIPLNRFDEAREVSEHVLKQQFDSPDIRGYLYQIGFVGGDSPGMQKQLDWAKGRPDEYVALDWQADKAAFAGQWQQAQDFSHRSIDLAIHSDMKDPAAQYAAKAAAFEAVLGKCSQAKQSADQALALALNQSERPQPIALVGLALCGEAARALQPADEYDKRFPKDTSFNGPWLPTIRAAVELQRGNAARAIELLESAVRYEGAGQFWPQYLRGQAYLKLNRSAEATTEFQKILDHRGEAPLSALYPLAHLGLARAASLMRETEKSLKAYENFFALWKDADTDIPILQQAKREYEKLRS